MKPGPMTTRRGLSGRPAGGASARVVEQLRADDQRGRARARSESIAYQMPALRSHGGQFLVSYAAFKNHYSLFPASDVVVATLGDALTPYLAGKGTIRFPASRPLPLDLVRRIVEIRVTENAAAARK